MGKEEQMKQLGISAFYHDSAVCLTIDGKVISAAEEERFTGIKHDSSFPKYALDWILKANNLCIKDIDKINWYESPEKKDDRVSTTFAKKPFKTFFLNRKYKKSKSTQNPKDILESMGYTGEIIYHDHHYSHAAFSYYTSPYDNAAILTVDGVGEWETTTISVGKGNTINKVLKVDFPNSLGMFYSTITAYLGFKPNEGEYKVMGLAPFGDISIYTDKLLSLFTTTSNKFFIDQSPFTWEYSDRVMFNRKLCRLLNLQPRLPGEEIKQEHKDLAAALQKVYEIQFTKLLKTAKNISKSDNICISGGCAYNGVANTLAYKYFKSVYVPFAPSDAGSAIGACLDSHTNTTPYLGPEFTDREVKKDLNLYRDKLLIYNLDEDKLIDKTAKLINGGNIVAWFQGKMEFGARSLGNRSILANPRDPKMKDRLNYVVKQREGFRPFAPTITEEEYQKFFEASEPSPYMSRVMKTRTKLIPSATHVDGTCRVQTVSQKQNRKFHKLITLIGNQSSIPVVLNTSFNLKDETITLTPKQAIERYLKSEIDFLVINNFLIKKR
jgi:carbamoyltransferase